MEDIEKEDYAYWYWLEDLCVALLSGKNMTEKKIIEKIEKRIPLNNVFLGRLLKKISSFKKNKRIIEKLPLLKDYPIGLEDDVYLEDEDLIWDWAEKTMKSIMRKLDAYKSISPLEYEDFFEQEIEPYKHWLYDNICSEIYEKALPEHVQNIWGCRKDKNIPWNDYNNIFISPISIIEGKYFTRERSLEDYYGHIEG